MEQGEPGQEDQQERAIQADQISALEAPRSSFREEIPNEIKLAYYNFFRPKGLKVPITPRDIQEQEEELSRRVSSLVSRQVTTETAFDEAGEMIAEGQLAVGRIKPSQPPGGVELPLLPSIPLNERQKEVYKGNLAQKVMDVLRTLPGDKGQEIAKKIIDKKNEDSERTSLFLEIQLELNRLKDDPNFELERGLKQARKILINAAVEAGALIDANEQLKLAQTVDDYTRQMELINETNVGIIEKQATEDLNRASPDFAGINSAYVHGARLWMQWGMLRALGEDSEADDKKREIELVTWGKNRGYFEDTARTYLRNLQREKREMIPKPVEKPRKDKLTESELKDLEKLESELVGSLVRGVLRPAARKVGDNVNIYPYRSQSHKLDFASEEFEEFKDKLVTQLGEAAESDRAKEIFSRMEKIRLWFEANRALLQAAGAVLVNYYDGLYMMLTVKERDRIDINTVDFYNLYSGLKEIEGWKLGKEIVKKQDESFDTMRGIAAVHRHSGRNVGREITSDYPVTKAQIEFVETVFASKKWIKITDSPSGKGEDQPTVEVEVAEKVEAISQIFTKESAYAGIQKILDDEKAITVLNILTGGEKEITRDFINWFSSNYRNLGEKSIWVDGVEWKISGEKSSEAVKKTLKELEYRVGSGDKVFVGQKREITKEGFKSMKGVIEGSNQAAVLKETPGAIDNLFVMAQDPATVDETRRKIEVMMEMLAWRRLKDGEDVNKLLQEFADKMKIYRGNILNETIVETTRVALLYFLEGARLGWGFDYKKDKDLGIYKREVEEGGTKATTDIATVFDWLRVEGKNNWKDWSHGPLPMDKSMAYQLSIHEPGWAPKLEGDSWEVTFMGKKLRLNATRKFDMSLLEATKVTKGREELKDKRIMDLILDGWRMSHIPWRGIGRNAPYTWYVTLSQTLIPITILTKMPDRDTMQKYFGFDVGPGKTGNALYELWKKSDLGFRDMEKDKDVRRVVPLDEALTLVWTENVLPGSPRPARFLPGDVRYSARESRASLRQLVPRGNEDMASEMASEFERYVNWFIDTGTDYKVERARLR